MAGLGLSMKNMHLLFSMLKADFLERTRRSSFLVTLCLIICMGYAVNAGQILIKLDAYRGIYNSAWVGSLMAVVITFFLGIAGFFLVKGSIERDENSGVGQIIATTPINRPQYLLGKWLSNFAVLAALVFILILAALLMQMINREDAQIQIWALMAPFLFIALPMMAMVAAFAIFFETVPWLKGGFGNLVYFFLFMVLFTAGVFLPQFPWLDVTGITLVGANMKAAAKAAFPDYQGTFVLSMISENPLQTFVWHGLNWTADLIIQRMLWLVISVGTVLTGVLFFNRFDPSTSSISKQSKDMTESIQSPEEAVSHANEFTTIQLTPLAIDRHFHWNIFRLVWLECLMLAKGLKWYWLAGMAVLWIGCITAPSENIRKFWFMLVCIWPVLIWSKMGVQEIRYQTEQLIYQSAYPLMRLLMSSWLAGIIITALAASGVLFGRLFNAEPIHLLPWFLSVLFIPTLALTLGMWGRSSKLFEVIYPILWYLGPFNRESGLAVIDYLGIHAQSPINTSPFMFAGFIILLFLLALVARRRQIHN
jgi:hypothetical protein